MKNKDILALLENSYRKITPNDAKEVIKSCSKKKRNQEGEYFMKKEQPKNMWRVLGTACAAIILVIGVYFGLNAYNQNHVVSLISLDVNPSIEIEVNKDRKIIKANALNEDASKVLQDIKLEQVDLNTGMHAIIGSMLKNGYIDEIKNSILVTVQNDSKEEGEKLQKELSEEINAVISTYKIEGSIVSQTINKNDALEQKAKENNISEGKAKMIEEIIAKNPTYTFAELAKLNINELNLLGTTKTNVIENVNVQGSASEKAYIGRDKAKSIALEHAKVKESNAKGIDIEFDYDDGKMVYDVEFYASGTEYDYEIDALSGAIIEANKEKDDDYHNGDNDNSSNDTEGSANDNNQSTSKTVIGRDKAKNTALSHAGVSSSNAYDLEVELDEDDGKYIYEVSFQTSTHEYEYDIDAYSGKVLKYKKEKED